MPLLRRRRPIRSWYRSSTFHSPARARAAIASSRDGNGLERCCSRRQSAAIYSRIPEPGTTEVAQASEFDLLIVGGGINGVGIARDAAGRGLRACLVEQADL